MSVLDDVEPDDYNICNEIRNGEQDVVRVTCNYCRKNPPIRGRYVAIRRKDGANERHLMNFCEVEVLSCPPGRWGKDLANGDCSRSCDDCVDQTCGMLDGHCYSGCDEQCDCQECDHLPGCPTGESQSDDIHVLFFIKFYCKMSNKQECIPVGCISTAALTVFPVGWGRSLDKYADSLRGQAPSECRSPSEGRPSPSEVGPPQRAE